MSDPPGGILQAILGRLEALEQASQPAGAEALNPNYLTLGLDGSIGANFSGFVNAKGIILPSALNNIVARTNAVQWQRTGDGAHVAFIQGFQGGNNITQLFACAIANAVAGSTATLGVEDDLGGFQANLGVSQTSRGNGAIVASVNGASPQVMTLWNSASQASFIKNATPSTPSDHMLNFGAGSFVGGGGAPQNVTQLHGLNGNTPTFATIFPYSWDLAGTAGNPVTMPGALVNDATSLYFTAWRSGAGFANGTTYFYYWLAGY